MRKTKIVMVLVWFVSLLGLVSAEKVNVLFIPIDDLKPLLGCYGYGEVHSPNIDRLAKRGTVFTNSSCQQAICGPSRASLMTGRYPNSTKVFDLATKMRDVNPDILSIPQYFKQNGYVTTGIGKTYDPRCVDKFLDQPSWSRPYVKNSYFRKDNNYSGGYRNPKTVELNRKVMGILKKQKVKEKSKKKKIFRDNPGSKPVTECADVKDDMYTDGDNTSRAIEMMKELANGDEPFFFSVGYSKPHLPFVAPKKYWDMYDRSEIKLSAKEGKIQGIPSWVYQIGTEMRQGYTGVPAEGNIPKEMKLELIHGYLACVSYIDAQVGRLLDTLDELGIADNTVVCLWGDHGFHLGDHENWCKHSNFEEAVRVPLIISSPKQKQKGAKSSSPVELVDIFPTLCEVSGLNIPSVVEGKSIMAQLDDANAKVRKAALHQYPRRVEGKPAMGYSLRTERYRYVKWLKMDYKKGARKGELCGRELYDFQNDPLETTNIAGKKSSSDLVVNFEKMLKERGVAQHTKVRKDAFGMN
ncbi:MAG: sulfatase [Planctomycetes bacterium]|nr:sulfatase [Planctomycetota bacterium]